MAGYLIADQVVTDEALFAEFARGMFDLVGAHKARFLARGGTMEISAGDRPMRRVVVIEFESFEKAQAFINSAEYKSLGEMRDRSCIAHALIVEGV